MNMNRTSCNSSSLCKLRLDEVSRIWSYGLEIQSEPDSELHLNTDFKTYVTLTVTAQHRRQEAHISYSHIYIVL